jgi:hypothetical protein
MISRARVPGGERARELIDTLGAVAPRFAIPDRRTKLQLLDRLAGLPIRDPRALTRLHETLCFLQAYPDDRRVLAAVDEALATFPGRVKGLSPVAARRLQDSGIAGTALDYPFGLPMAAWLASRFPRQVEIAWKKFHEADRLQESLMLLLQRTEHDSASDEGGLGWRRWLETAKGGRELSDLELLLELFQRADVEEPTRDWLFESLALPIGWRLDGAGASRTFARLAGPRPCFRGGRALRRPDAAELMGEARRPMPSLRPASPPLARRLIEAARLAMATRLRELFAFSYANPADVRVGDARHGLRIALIGILPASRMPYEGYYAYLALQNGVPVGYGAAWQLFDTLELAVNVFESFRGGESAAILSQVLRAYHQAFGMKRVVVDPYQIGRDNPEALRSGAFYFYHRLGFRPRDPAVRRLAEEEREKIARQPAYRSPLAVLEKLAGSEISLVLADDAAPEPVTASRLATLVTEHIARRFRGDRRAAARAAVTRVVQALGVRRRRHWPPDERRAFDQLSLPIALIPDLDRWPAADRRRLVQVLRAKGGSSEARYVRLLGGHGRLRRSLVALIEGASTGQE